MPPKTSKQKNLLLVCSGLAALYLFTSKDGSKMVQKGVTAVRDMSLPRGLRNNNPLNLRKGVNWIGRDGDDGAFDIFKTVEYGIRAGLQNFKTQYGRGYNTVSKLITKWAPPSENNTKQYIDFVAKNANVASTTKINLSDSETVSRILYAMAQQENGVEVTKKKLPYAQFAAVVKQFLNG